MIEIWDPDGHILFDGRITELAVPDRVVRDLSLKFFNDPEPCQIHRSAVLCRVFAELEAALAPGERMHVHDLGDSRAYLSAYTGAFSIRRTE